MIRALIVDDEEHARNRLRRMLADFPEIDVVGEGQDGVEAIKLAQKLSPDVMLLDVNMPCRSGGG